MVRPDAVPFGHAPHPFLPLKINDAAVGVILGHIVDLSYGSVTGKNLQIIQFIVEAGLEMAGFEVVIIFLCQHLAPC